MPNITSVTLTAGVPTAGTGTVGTLDNVTGTAGSPSVPVLTVQGVASGTAQPISGTVTANAGTGTLATSLATLPALTTGAALIGKVDVQLAGTTPDVGSGTGGTKTQRVIMDSSQLSALSTTAQAMSTGFQLVDIPNNGTAARAAQLPAALGSGGGLKVDDIFGNYETVAASQTAQVMGATGATGDYLAYVTVFPGTAGCGVVTILDNATTWGTFAGGGTTALPSLVPFRIDVGAYSVSGAWKLTTGANVTVVGVGKFT